MSSLMSTQKSIQKSMVKVAFTRSQKKQKSQKYRYPKVGELKLAVRLFVNVIRRYID
jgi:hypothetical protein